MIGLIPLQLVPLEERRLNKAEWKEGYSHLRAKAKEGDRVALKILINQFSPIPEYHWSSFSRFARWNMRGAW